MFKGMRKKWVARGAITGLVALYVALTLGVTRPTLPQLLSFHQNEAHAAPSQSVLPNTGVSTYLSSQADQTGWPWDLPGFQASYNASLALIDTAIGNLIGGSANLSGSSASSFSAALAPGACATATPAIVGATTAMVAVSDPVTYPGDAFSWSSYVSSSGVVSVRLCNHTGATATATASVYRIRVLK